MSNQYVLATLMSEAGWFWPLIIIAIAAIVLTIITIVFMTDKCECCKKNSKKRYHYVCHSCFKKLKHGRK